jgi:hypothetical protein
MSREHGLGDHVDDVGAVFYFTHPHLHLGLSTAA